MRFSTFALACALLLAATLLAVHAHPLVRSERHHQKHHAEAASASTATATATAAGFGLSIDVSKPLANVSQDLWGVFFEEINHAGVGGLYQQQIQNSNFEYGSITALYDPWYLLPVPTGIDAFISLNQDAPINAFSPYSIFVQTTGLYGTVGIANPGFWGINTVGVSSFVVSFWAFSPQGYEPSSITASLINGTNSSIVYGAGTFIGVDTEWTKYEFILEISPEVADPAAHFALTWVTTGTMKIYFDVITVFPNQAWNGLTYLRPQLAQLVADLHPSFVRFPGGCYVEGDRLMDRFNWKNALGDIEKRRGHWDLWGYYSEDGLGLYEYLSFVEQLTDVYGNPTRSIWVVNNGVAHQDSIPTTEIASWVQDALDSIEFALGNTSTPYGSIRAFMGHPEPFTSLAYVAIGNEDCGKAYYNTNYLAFYDALSQAYPDLTLIANCDLTSSNLPTQLFDYHVYTSAGYFLNNSHLFDTWSRSGAKVFNSEYAVTDDAGYGNAGAAIGEAAWMNGLERNSDLVTTASYAPLFVNTNDRFWNPDAIVFDTYRAYGTPSYWVQYLYANSYWGAIAGSVRTLGVSLDTGSTVQVGATVATLNSTISKEKGANTVYILKLVNWGSSAQSISLTLANFPSSGKLVSSADVLSITASSNTDENTFANPTLVAPVASTLSIGGSSSIAITVPAFTVASVRIYATV